MSNTSSYINSAGRKVLEYETQDSILLNLPFILCRFKRLTRNMPYMLLEGTHTMAIRLLEVRDVDGFVYLDVQELETNKTYTLSWNLQYEGEYWLWSLADFETLKDINLSYPCI